MISEAFNILCQIIVVVILTEIAVLILIIIEETFKEKRKRLRDSYKRNRDNK